MDAVLESRESLAKQRRMLLAISIAIAVVHAGRVELDSLAILGAKIAIERDWVLIAAAWSIWLYSILRFFQLQIDLDELMKFSRTVQLDQAGMVDRKDQSPAFVTLVKDELRKASLPPDAYEISAAGRADSGRMVHVNLVLRRKVRPGEMKGTRLAPKTLAVQVELPTLMMAKLNSRSFARIGLFTSIWTEGQLPYFVACLPVLTAAFNVIERWNDVLARLVPG